MDITIMGGGGGLHPKKPKRKRKKPVANLKFAVAFVFFSVFFGFFGFLWYFFGFFRSEIRQEIPAIQKSCKQ